MAAMDRAALRNFDVKLVGEQGPDCYRMTATLVPRGGFLTAPVAWHLPDGTKPVEGQLVELSPLVVIDDAAPRKAARV